MRMTSTEIWSKMLPKTTVTVSFLCLVSAFTGNFYNNRVHTFKGKGPKWTFFYRFWAPRPQRNENDDERTFIMALLVSACGQGLSVDLTPFLNNFVTFDKYITIMTT